MTTDPNVPNQVTPPEPNLPQNEQGLSAQELADQVMAGVNGTREGAVAEQPSPDAKPENTQAPSYLTGKQKVKWGDAEREVDIDELVKAAQEREETLQAKKVVESMLEKNVGAKKVIEFIESLPDERQQRFLEFMQNPDLLDAQTQATTDDDDFDLSLDGPSQSKKQGKPDRRDAELAELRSKVDTLVGYLHQQAQAEGQRTMASKVDETMASFSVFKENDAAKDFARNFIMNALAANPQADLESVVADAANRTQNLVSKSRQGVVRDVVPPGARNGMSVFSPSRAPTAADLESGRLRDSVESMLERYGLS